jgi:hypothetical protein
MKLTPLIAASLTLLGTTGATSSCSSSANLGDKFSAATGPNAYTAGPNGHAKFPSVHSVQQDGMPEGRDDAIAFFVGGNYYGKLGANF